MCFSKLLPSNIHCYPGIIERTACTEEILAGKLDHILIKLSQFYLTTGYLGPHELSLHPTPNHQHRSGLE